MAVIRKTKPVQIILKEFDKANDAISVVELVEKFKTTMDKTTVYRILERLEESGQLHSFMGKDGLKRYARWEKEFDNIDAMNIHPHFLCKNCGGSSCLPIKISIPKVSGYIIESAEQLLTGKCKDCTI